MKYIPSPGIVLIQPLQEASHKIIVQGNDNSRIQSGKVLAMGMEAPNSDTSKVAMNQYCKVGDIVYFLSYEGDYDSTKIEGQKYYLVKREDLRGVYAEK